MANLTGTQKKKRNQFIALLVAILVVLAAIFYVAYSAFMAKSAYLANEDFATALGSALGKSVRSVSEEDLAAVKYLEVYSDGETGAITIGDKAFVDTYTKYLEETEEAEKAKEAGEEVPEVTPLDTSALKYSVLDLGKETVTLGDIKYFTGVEIGAFSGVNFNAEDLEALSNVKRVNFSVCGLTNEHLAAFAKNLDLEKVEELTFMEDAITDWSPLESISDKVILQSYGIQMTEDGQYTFVPTEETLTEYLKAKAEEEAKNAEEAEEKAEGEEATEATETTETTEETEEATEVTE